MKQLTRQEIWEAICNKYPTFKAFNINCRYGEWSSYRSRPELLEILFELKLHKSRHLKKQQKIRLKYEMDLIIIDKL